MSGSRGNPNLWLIAIVVTMGAFMEVLDTTIVNVALPHIAGSLAISNEEFDHESKDDTSSAGTKCRRLRCALAGGGPFHEDRRCPVARIKSQRSDRQGLGLCDIVGDARLQMR
jgi:hypothetical protein